MINPVVEALMKILILFALIGTIMMLAHVGAAYRTDSDRTPV